MDLQVTEVKTILAERIQQFRLIDPEKYSYKFMSKKLGLAPSYIERAAKGKLGDQLDSKKIMSIVELVCGPEEVKKIAGCFVNSFFSDSNRILKQALLDEFAKQKENSSSEIERALEEDEVFITYALCSNSGGASRDKIRMVLGDSSVIGIDKLEQMNLISEKDGRYFSVPGKAFGQYETIKKQLTILTRLYKPSNVGKEKNYVHIMTEGLNEQGVKAWQEEHKKHQEKLRSIKNQCKGDIDVFSVGFMDTFLPDQF